MARRVVLVGCAALLGLLGLTTQAPGQDGGLIVQADESGVTLALDADAGLVTVRQTVNEVSLPRLIDVAGSPVRLVTWVETSPDGRAVPYYAISLDGRSVATVRPTSYALNLRHGAFHPQVEEPLLAPELEADEDVGMYIVQFVTQPLEEFRQAIEEAGGTVYQFLTNHAHFVRMDAAAQARVAQLPFVRWIGPVHPAYKLEEEIRDQIVFGHPIAPRRYSIMLYERGVAAQDRVSAYVAAEGGTVHGTTPRGFRVEATMSLRLVQRVVALDDVMFIDRKGEFEPDMDIVREIGGADYIEGTLGFTGQGVRAEVADTELDVWHQEWSDPPIIHLSGTGIPHGTSVYGILFAQGSDPQARGLIPDGVGIFAASSSLLGGGPTRYTHTAELVDPDGPYRCVLQTNSTGDPRTFYYTTISAEMDDILFLYDIAITQSQSNAGNQDSRPQAWAKNIISGGAVRHYNTFTRSDDCWCFSGSVGPADDGRIKPDLCFFYDDTFAPSSGGGYTQFGGTSGATPSIAGYLGLFFQMWSEGVLGNEEEVDPEATVFENRCHMTTAKAVMINTAAPYPFTGTGHDLTRVHQGWGMPDLHYLYDSREKLSILDESDILTNLESIEYSAYVDPDEPELRVTMVYADPMGVPSASVARINDLTLRVTSPSDEVYWGNGGLLEGNWSTPGGSPNTVDTVENVFVQDPEPGVWSVEVIASEINEDGHPETPELDADFALVVTGANVSNCTSDGRISLSQANYGCSSLVEIHVADCDLNADDLAVETIEVTIASTSESGGETVLLTETAAETANFIGTVQLTSSDADGQLHASEGDLITATYVDADDGLGGSDVVVTVEATVIDCGAPLIHGLQINEIEPHSAVISFSTDEPAIGMVRFGPACDQLTQTVAGAELSTSHTLMLDGLDDTALYYFAVQAADEWDNLATEDAEGECHAFFTLTVVLEDDFEGETGWTVENVDLTSGGWDRGVPVNCGRGDPPTDHDGSGQAFLTDNRSSTCNTDIDGGPTRLMSPLLDLTTVSDPILTYSRWFTNDDLDADRMDVEISNDGGDTWVLVEVATGNDAVWVRRHIRITDYLAPTDQVMVRFSAVDNPSNSITEAGVDAFRVASFQSVQGDFDLDRDIDLADFSAFQECFGQVPTGTCSRGNMNGDQTINLEDFAQLANLLTGPE